jgi:hypothetical protein
MDAPQPAVEPLPAPLAAKIAEVVAEVEGVGKHGRNDFHKYNYATAEDVFRAVRGALAARRVAIVPSVLDVEEREYETSRGSASTITTVTILYTVIDGDSGEKWLCHWRGQGDDPADKGLAKAYTNAKKTFLRDLLALPQGDDPEADHKTDERAQDRRAGPPQPVWTPTQRRIVELVRDRGITSKTLMAELASIGADVYGKTPAEAVGALTDGQQAKALEMLEGAGAPS